MNEFPDRRPSAPLSSAEAALRLKVMAAAWGEPFFRRLTTREHEVAACILAGDSLAQTARYVEISPSTVRRVLVRIVARLSAAIPLSTLLADDHPVHRLMLRTIFESFGCSVKVVEDGAAAASIGGAFDLVCLDRHMPGLSGDAAAERLRGQSYLVACTSDPEGASDAFDAVVAKPASVRDISRIIEQALRFHALGGPES